MIESVLFSNIDNSLLNVNYDDNRDKSFRRYCYTWNNPFWNSEEFEEVDITNTDLLLDLEHYDLRNLKSDFNKDFFDFRYIKYTDYKTQELKVIERPFFKDSNAIRNYISNFSTFKYSCFQIEKGGNSETVHIQGFLTLKNPMTWSTFKNFFPCSHFNKCISSNTDCRRYCSKEDTRIDGPYEDGEFSEERSRSDCKEFIEAVRSGVSNLDLAEINPRMFIQQFKNIDLIRNEFLFNEFKFKERELEVTYIYGAGGLGKTSYVRNKHGLGNYYSVDGYGSGAFDNYSGEDIVLFDEFTGQIRCTYMNRLLDRYPVQLQCRYYNKWACFSKVYIIGNTPLDMLYSDTNIVAPAVKQAFLRRIHNVIRFTAPFKWQYEKRKGEQIKLSLEPMQLTEADEAELDAVFGDNI